MNKLDQAYLTDLVIRSQKGSSNAFAELYTATQERVCRYLGSLPGTEDLAAALKAAGFTEVKCDRHPEKPWLTVLAKK